MSGNQTQFEVVRDIAFLEGKMKEGDTLVVTIKKTSACLYEWNSNMGDPYGCSETSSAMQKAFDETSVHRAFRGVHRPAPPAPPKDREVSDSPPPEQVYPYED